MTTVINSKKFIDFFDDDDIIAEMLKNNYDNVETEYDISDLSDYSDNDEYVNEEKTESDSEDVSDDEFIPNEFLDLLDKDQLEHIEKLDNLEVEEKVQCSN